VHPSFEIEKIIKHGSGDVETVVRRTRNKPILLLPARQDVDLKPDSDAVRLLAKRRPTLPDKISIEFPNMSHGWVSRGDSSNPLVKGEQERATEMMVNFFNEHYQ
jgi:hypothetical protein